MKHKNLSFDPYEGEEPFVYACYSHVDKEVIGDLEYLKKKGFRIWYDLGIGESNNWKESMTDHITKCKLFMIFVSARAIQSDYVLNELQIARNNNKMILPIFLEDIRKSDDLDYISLTRIQGINRWEYGQNLEKYYIQVINNLTKLSQQYYHKA